MKLAAPPPATAVALLLLLSAAATDAASAGAVDYRSVPLKRSSFPKDFVFGTAASAYQVEGMALDGGRGPCVWDEFIKIPGLIPNNATAALAVDEYHRYREDVDIMKKLGFDAYRFSISWSRIFPEGTGRINWEGVDYYNRLIDYMLLQGIVPYANLHHYDIPLALVHRYGGWLNSQVANDFADFADLCFKMYGDRVKNWFTFNEPRVIAALGYDNGFHAPGRCTVCANGGNSATEPYIVAHNLLRAHGSAVKRYRDKYQAEQKGKIGILLDFVWYEGLTNSTEDQMAAHRARDFHVGWFLEPIAYGQYPKNMKDIVADRLPEFTCDEVKMIKGSADYIGINQYTTYYVRHHVNTSYPSYANDWHAKFEYERDGKPIGEHAYSDWLYIVPWGLYKAVTYVKEKYGSPTIILAENGMDQPGSVALPEGLRDRQRVGFYRKYLRQLLRAINDGADVVGYFAWSLLDNFEWRLGYSSRFGIVYVDWNTLQRYPKDSALMFKKMMKD